MDTNFNIYLTAAYVFLIVMNISQNPLNPQRTNKYSEQNKKGGKWYVGNNNSNIGLSRLVFLALHIHRVCPVPRTPRTKCCKQGELSMYRTIVLDCQTNTATPCSEDCIAYKTCTAHMKSRQAYTHACYISL